MSQPSRADIHVDAVLTSMAMKYMQNAANFIASLVFPIVPVDKQSDKYRIWTKGDWFRDEAKLRAPATESVASGYTMSTTSFFADVWALAKYVADQDRANQDAGVNLDQGAVDFVTQRLLLRREIQWVADFFATSKWATDKTVASKWDDYANSDPISDIEEGKATILEATGFEPNKLVLGYHVWRYLKNHPDIIDRLGLGGSSRDTRVVTREAVAAIFEVDQVLVAKAVKNSAAEGNTVSMALTHGKHALLTYAPPSPSTEVPSAGYTFAWRGLNGGGTAGVPGLTVSRFREDLKKADKVEAEMAWDNKITGTDLGYFFPSVVA
jgi:hypothetical protein